MTLELQVQEQEEALYLRLWGKYTPGRGNSRGKAPEVRESLACSKNIKSLLLEYREPLNVGHKMTVEASSGRAFWPQ